MYLEEESFLIRTPYPFFRQKLFSPVGNSSSKVGLSHSKDVLGCEMLLVIDTVRLGKKLLGMCSTRCCTYVCGACPEGTDERAGEMLPPPPPQSFLLWLRGQKSFDGSSSFCHWVWPHTKTHTSASGSGQD